MKSLTKEIVDETNIFLKLSQLAYFDDISSYTIKATASNEANKTLKNVEHSRIFA